MPVFRVEKNKDFTVMSNYHLRDKNLSNKSKGLLSIILTLPDDWDYSTNGLAKICKDGAAGIQSQLKELEEYGYITREKTRNEKGQIIGIEYTIHEKPEMDKPKIEKPEVENPLMVKPHTEIQVQPNKDIPNIETNNYSPTNQRVAGRADVEREIYEQLEVECLKYQYSENQLDDIVSLIADVMCSNVSSFRINGADINSVDVKNRFRLLNSEHISYVIDYIDENTPNIRNIRSYYLTMLYNAPSTMDSYYAAKSKSDLKGGLI